MITGHGIGRVRRRRDEARRGRLPDQAGRPRSSCASASATIVEKRLLSTPRDEELEERLGEKFGSLIGHSKADGGAVPPDGARRADARERAHHRRVGDRARSSWRMRCTRTRPAATTRFLPINCAAIPAEILESELFGHERGSFTGATGRKLGKFELADGGTAVPGRDRRAAARDAGEAAARPRAARVHARRWDRDDPGRHPAHRRDQRGSRAPRSSEGRFRSDLYYRLKVVTLRIPPLRERAEDIPLLTNHFLQSFARRTSARGCASAPRRCAPSCARAGRATSASCATWWRVSSS